MPAKKKREEDVFKTMSLDDLSGMKGASPRDVPPKAWSSRKPPGGQLRGRLPSKPKPAKRDEG